MCSQQMGLGSRGMSLGVSLGSIRNLLGAFFNIQLLDHGFTRRDESFGCIRRALPRHPCSGSGRKLLSAQTRRLCQEDSVKNTCI